MTRLAVLLSAICLSAELPAAADDLSDRVPDKPAEPPPNREEVVADAEQPPELAKWRGRGQLLGDIGGLRPWLAARGMSLEIVSQDEGFGIPDGGHQADTTGRYAGLTDVVFSIDTEGAGWWRGGLFVIDLQNARGGDISDAIGDVQGISNIVGPPGTRFAEYFLQQELAGGAFSFKFGKQDANADFVVSHGGGAFINSSFGIIPTVPLPTYPAPALGLMTAWSPSRKVLLKAGLWDGAPEVGSGSLETAFDGSGGIVGALGVEVSPFGSNTLPGTYRFGVWRHSEVELAGSAKDATGASLGPTDGLYFTVDQGLWKGGDRSLAFFAQGGWGEADRSAVSRYLGGGLTFSAPFARRPGDLLGVGVAHAEIGELELRGPRGGGSETIVELFYRLPVTPWMSLIPDLQWVHQPGGDDRTAFVAGLRAATVF